MSKPLTTIALLHISGRVGAYGRLVKSRSDHPVCKTASPSMVSTFAFMEFGENTLGLLWAGAFEIGPRE